MLIWTILWSSANVPALGLPNSQTSSDRRSVAIRVLRIEVAHGEEQPARFRCALGCRHAGVHRDRVLGPGALLAAAARHPSLGARGCNGGRVDPRAHVAPPCACD